MRPDDACGGKPLSTEMGEAWYVVQTKPRQEFRAQDHLQRQGFRCILPLIRLEKIRRGARTWIEEPLFARYVFIEMGGPDANWSVLRSTRGVSQVVRFGGVPARMPVRWMDSVLSCDREPVRLFNSGQRVVVTDGPFTGFEGIYQLPDGETRAIVLLELLGKPCNGSFPVEALRRAA
jgi:transcriptional antiterminator RfaH